MMMMMMMMMMMVVVVVVMNMCAFAFTVTCYVAHCSATFLPSLTHKKSTIFGVGSDIGHLHTVVSSICADMPTTGLSTTDLTE